MRIFYASLFSFFKKTVPVIFIGSLVSMSALAQVSNYNFSQVLGTYTPITGGTVVVAGTPTDDNTWGPLPIGFSFTYNSTTYTEVTLSANGYIKFGNVFPGCCWYGGT